MKLRSICIALLLVGMPVAAMAAPSMEIAPSPMASTSESRRLFDNAWHAYAQARQSLAEPTRSNAYADAIASISRAAALDLGNVEILVLGSQIYRGKGGLSYAKQYFLRAESILMSRIQANPDDIGAHLDYAILCWAGDARHWPEAAVYQKKAKEHARKAIALCAKHANAKENGSLMRAMAVAYLARGDAKRGEKLLKKASTMDATNAFYYHLYMDTVVAKKWLWPTKSFDKEFLLYYIMNSRRNVNLE